MLVHEPALPSVEIGASLTIPGPPLPVETMKALWHRWCNRLNMGGWSMVWRLEVQKRGQCHWHVCASRSCDGLRWSDAIGGCPGVTVPHAPPDTTVELATAEASGDLHDWQVVAAASVLRKSWLDALAGLGPFDYDPPVSVGKRGRMISHVESLAAWPGADQAAVQVSADGGHGSWRRYMQDHASKSKQEQIAEGIGRHWGVVGRKRYKRALPADVDRLPDRAFWRFLRAYQRLCTPQLKDKRPVGKACPFGRRLGRRIRRGGRGQSIWYSRPETVKRLASWALCSETVAPAADQVQRLRSADRVAAA